MLADLMYKGYILHIFGGFFLTFLGIMWRPLFLSGFIAGVGKEIIDFYDYGLFDVGDMWMTFGGSAVGLFAAIHIYIALKKNLRYHPDPAMRI